MPFFKKYLLPYAKYGSFLFSKSILPLPSRGFRAAPPLFKSLPPHWLSLFNTYKPWFKYPRYINPSFYRDDQTSLYYRPLKNRPLKDYLGALQPSKDLLEKLGNKAHFIEVAYIEDDFILQGRLGKYLQRDEMFARLTKECLAHLLENSGLEATFFINYTGHQAPVASILYEYGIDCVWQLKKEHFPSFSGRIVEQLHDWPNRSALNTATRITTSFGLILEPNHGFTPISAAHLPSQQALERVGVKRVVVLTEYPFNAKKFNYDYDPLHFKDDPEFASYLTELSKKYSLQIMGTELEVQLKASSDLSSVPRFSR